MSKDGRSLLWWCLGWAMAVLQSGIFQPELVGALWIIYLLWLLMLMVTGGVLTLCLIVLLVKEIKQENRAAWRSFVPLFLLCTLTIAWIIRGMPGSWQIRWSFQRWRYERARADIQRLHPGETRGRVDGLSYQRDREDPRLISFPLPGGILDNYSSIVYDPTDRLRRASEIKGNWYGSRDPRLTRARGLFGGEMCGAEPLGGGWYLCGFT